MKTRRLKRIEIDPRIIQRMMFQGEDTIEFRVLSGIPTDATLVSYGFAGYSDMFWFIYEHESFEEVKLGEMVTLVNAIYKIED